MAYAYPGAGALDYSLCHYEGSRILFRGPMRSLERPYVAILGGTESYGKFVERPFAELLEDRLGLNVVNLACVNAGIDVYLAEEKVTRIAARAEAVVVQVTGAQNISNRFYAVHPRRNDRFLGATPLLRSIYRQVDFTEFSFTRHMLGVLQQTSREKFALIAAELRQAWVQRMRLLIDRLPPQRILLWMAEAPPPMEPVLDLYREPLLVDAQMIAALEPLVTHFVRMIPSQAAMAEGPEGRICSEMERPAAQTLPGQTFHREVSERLADLLERMV